MADSTATAADIATGNLLDWGPTGNPGRCTEPKEYDPENYSNEFLCFAQDLNGDGWTDLVVVGFPGAKTRWLQNPGGGGAWPPHPAVEKTGNESPDWLDVEGMGARSWSSSRQGVAFADPGTTPQAVAGPRHLPARATRARPWAGRWRLNGDGRDDIICPEGWWEGPEKRASRGLSTAPS